MGHLRARFLNYDPSWWSERGLKSLSMMSYSLWPSMSPAILLTERPCRSSRTSTHRRQCHDLRSIAASVPETSPTTKWPSWPTQSGQVHQGPGPARADAVFVLQRVGHRTTRNEPLLQFRLCRSIRAGGAIHQSLGHACHRSVGRLAGRRHRHPHRVPPRPPQLGLQNSHRLDIVLLPRQQAVELTEQPRRLIGHRVNGKVLPSRTGTSTTGTPVPELDYGGKGTNSPAARCSCFRTTWDSITGLFRRRSSPTGEGLR